MGMFDTIEFNCPNCGTEMEGQTKSGDCCMEVFPHTEVPVEVAYGANRHAPLICEKCKKQYFFDTHVIPKPAIVNLPIKEYNGENIDKY